MSPKRLKEEEYNYKCNLWSIGIIIYKLMYGKSPYLALNEMSLIIKINMLGNRMINIENAELNNLVKRLLERDPKRR